MSRFDKCNRPGCNDCYNPNKSESDQDQEQDQYQDQYQDQDFGFDNYSEYSRSIDGQDDRKDDGQYDDETPSCALHGELDQNFYGYFCPECQEKEEIYFIVYFLDKIMGLYNNFKANSSRKDRRWKGKGKRKGKEKAHEGCSKGRCWNCWNLQSKYTIPWIKNFYEKPHKTKDCPLQVDTAEVLPLNISNNLRRFMNLNPDILECFVKISETTGLSIPKTLGQINRFIIDACEYFPNQTKLLFGAIEEHKDTLARFLISRGATAINYAIERGQIYLATELFDLGDGNGNEDIFYKFNRDKTALMWAIDSCNYTIIEYLLEFPNARTHINDQNSNGENALMYLINIIENNLSRYIQISDILLKNGADINIKNNNNKTCLDIAKNFYNSYYSKVVTTYLIANGATESE